MHVAASDRRMVDAEAHRFALPASLSEEQWTTLR